MPKKTIIIGLGGTGDWVLTFLKSRLYAAYGETETKKDVQFLLVDTIHESTREAAFADDSKRFQVKSGLDQHEEMVAHLGSVRVENHEYLPLTGSIRKVAESIAGGQDRHTRHLDWFAARYYLTALPEAAMNVTDGAGQWRQFGRMSLCLSAERGEFTSRVGRLLRSAQVPPDSSLMVYVVCSLAGGTGAGTFLDAANLVRREAARQNTSVWVVGFFVLPSAFGNVLGDKTMGATKTRSFAAYRELVRFQTLAGGEIPFSVRYSMKDEVLITTKLFDTVFLLDADSPVVDLTQVPPWSGISPSIADSLEVFIDRTAGSAILQNLINASARMADEVRVDQTLPAQFHTTGSHKLVLPARQYASIFTSRFVVDFLRRMFPTAAGSDELARVGLTDSEYRETARDFVAQIPKLFTALVPMLPDFSEGPKRLRAFAARPVEDYRSYLRPSAELPPGADLQLLTQNPIQDIPTGKVAGDSAEDATRRIAQQCAKRLEAYWGKVDQTLAALVKEVERDVTSRLHEQAKKILNREVDQLAEHCVGTLVTYLHEISSICEDLLNKVLGPTEKAINDQLGGQNSLGHWETALGHAQTAMEDTKGFDGFFSRGKAYSAQSGYLEVQGKYLERKRLDKVFTAYRSIVSVLKKRAEEFAGQLTEWADIAALSDRYSARTVADGDIAEVENALVRGGETYTVSYGLNAYAEGTPVDPAMGGYRQRLYERFTAKMFDAWARQPHWELRAVEDDTGAPLGHELVLEVDRGEGRAPLALRPESGRELYQQVFDAAREELFPQVTGLTIFDYFLDEGLTPQQVAEYLKEHTGPLIGDLIPQGSGSHEVHLLVKNPTTEDGVRFLQAMESHLVSIIDQPSYQKAKERDFDNPYTLTLLYVVQDLRDGQLAAMNEYEESYNEQLRQSDTYVVNHVFRCEQEAARIEKEHMLTHGQAGTGGWKRLAPRITRLLEHPRLLTQFLELMVMGMARLERDPADKRLSVWMVVPPTAASAADPKVVWLTAPPAAGGESRGTNRSPLLAMERFCFVGNSAKPGGTIPIDYAALDRALAAERNTLFDSAGEGGSDPLIAKYEAFAAGPLEEALTKGVEALHSEAEIQDLVLVSRYYLDGLLNELRASV